MRNERELIQLAKTQSLEAIAKRLKRSPEFIRAKAVRAWRLDPPGRRRDMTREAKLRCPICLREGLADISPDDPKARVVAVTEGFSIKNKTEVFCSRCQVPAFRPDPIQ